MFESVFVDLRVVCYQILLQTVVIVSAQLFTLVNRPAGTQ